MRIEKPKSPLPRCLGLVLALCLLPPALPCPAQPPLQKENRFLFIINTSADMRRETNAVQQAVRGLLQSSMQGQMRDGDTFGLWTYDDQLHTDFPMQIWSKRNQDDIAAAVAGFLAGRRYQNRPRLEKVLPALRQTIANSRVLTVIFIFDGSETMQGSGFDKDINDLQRQFGRQMRANHIPFVTLLAVWNGKAIDFSVNTPAKISMLQTADLLQPPASNAPPAGAPAAPAAPPVVIPKPAPPRHFEIILTNTPEPGSLSSSPTEAATEQPPPPAEPAVAAQPSAPPPVPAATVAPAVPAAQVQVALVPASPSVASVSAAPAVPAALAQVTLAPADAPPPGPAATIAPAVPATPVQPASVVTPPPVQTARPAVAPAPPVAQTAVVAPAPGGHIALLVIAFSLLAIAVVLILLFLRRSRSASSLITQSLDNPR
jgi:hypothetical protein